MTQPVWITPAGSLGTWPEGVFYKISMEAQAAGQDVFFRLIAGELPPGVQLSPNGTVEGTPRNLVDVQGSPREVSQNTTSRFAIRAYTEKVVGNQTVIDRLADRTFLITVAGQDLPEFITPPGEIAQFYDGTRAETRIEFTDPDPDDSVRISLISGELPPGMVLDPRTGIISGIIIPLVGPPGTARAGFDRTEFDEYAFDFSTQAQSRGFEFVVGITDGQSTNLRTFSIFVYATDNLNASDTFITADDTFITADVSSRRTPLLLTPAGSLGVVRADNYFAFRFTAVDWDGDPIEFVANESPGLGFSPLDRNDALNFEPGSFDFDNEPFDQGSFSLPPGLSLNQQTGWLTGYIPDQLITEQTYQFGIRVRKVGDGSTIDPGLSSPEYFFTLTVIGDIEIDTIWITDSDLGIINNGAISMFKVEAKNFGGASLQYQLAEGFDNKLPQGLSLQTNGDIVGRVSFNTFALDGGFTTFDVNSNPRLGINKTTFDLKFDFTVNAFAESSAAFGYEIISLSVTDGGSGYDPLNPPAVVISAPPLTENSIQATAGAVTIVGGVITAIAIGNPGRGYLSAPTVTIGGSGGATATAQIQEISTDYAISVFRRFSITIDRIFNEPYETLYIKAMPPIEDRQKINLLLDTSSPNALIPSAALYRSNDPNFGIATGVVYNHAYGLTSASLASYVAAMNLNHYWKNITLGPIKNARALDSSGSIVYEVIYSEIIDNLVNDQGQSVGKSVDLPYTIDVDGEAVDVVYPNSLINMRDQIIDSVGQISPALPLWMTSKQKNNQVLGFTPAWVIAYVKPNESDKIIYNIQNNITFDLNAIDYEVDRYEIDRSQTYNWSPEQQSWIPSPPQSTTFDYNTQRLYYTPTLSSFGRIISTSIQYGFGTDTQFTVTPAVPSPYVMVQLNGTLQTYAETTNSGITGDFWIYYAFNSFTVQFVNAPPSTSTIYTADGSSSDYLFTPLTNRGLVVKIDGVTQTLGTDYTVLIDKIIFATPPQEFAPIEIIQPSTVSIYQIIDIYVNDPNSPYQTQTTWDQGATTFNTPADRWIPTDEFDKYLVFPKRTIIG